jgi:hypothetical protein
MTPEQQRIAIAMACPERLRQVYTLRQVHSRWQYFDGTYWFCCKQDDPITDLNAMHEARKVLTHDQQVEYSVQLGKLVTSHLPASRSAWMDYYIANATAAQRAEAFLRTLNLWTPCAT